MLGLAIMFALSVAVTKDHTDRLDIAQRQSLTLATSVDRALMYELRNVERAMRGIAADSDVFFRSAPAQAPALLSESIAGVRLRHSELEALVLLDARGRALTNGPSDPTLPAWRSSAAGAVPPLSFGPLQKDRDQAWVIPIALRTDHGHWLLARLRTAEIQRMVGGLDTGRDGEIAVFDLHGVVLARSGASDAYTGHRVSLPDLRKGAVSIERNSELDGVARIAAFSAGSGYPLVTGAGISLREALVHWREHVAAAMAVVLLYWLGLLFFVRRLAAAEDMREDILHELHASTDWLRQAQLVSRTGVWRLETEAGPVRASEQTAALFGFAPTVDTIPMERFFERMHDDDRERVAVEFGAARDRRAPFDVEFRVVLPDGQVRWLRSRGALANDSHGKERITGTIVDITERREATSRIERAELQFRELFERNPLPFWVYDIETLRFMAVNEAAIRNYGYTREEFLAMTILEIRPAEDADAVRDSARGHALANDGRVWVHVTRHGKRMDVRVHSSDIEFMGRAARLVLAEDVSERVAYERDLAWRATHDATTGMLMVDALVEQLDALPRTDRDPGYAIACVQLRDLELVAPTLGRRAGQTILRAAANRFGEIGRTYGFAAYLPAESFVVVAVDPAQRDAMLASLVQATATPVQAESGTHPLEAWIGLADGPMQGEGTEQVIGNAALAALKARQDSVPIVRFDTTMAAQASGRLAMAGRLRQALGRHEFELFFQPIQRVADGRLTTLEALLRWRQPDGSFASPAQFIPLCEESGLIVPLGDWVLEEAARCHGLLAAEGLGDVAIAVNVSAVQFLSETLLQTLHRLRTTYALPRGALHVELTESSVLRRPDAARAAMSELRDEGVCISIDDFGTGFSSMAYLKDLPLDYLKLDRYFVADVHHEERNAAICRALIELGQGLDLKIIAEGVETAGQLEWLRAHGCDQAQGYHFGRPAPIADVLEAIRRPCLDAQRA